jgi:hypothetical protein
MRDVMECILKLASCSKDGRVPRRGLCTKHYNAARAVVKSGVATWEQLHAQGKAARTQTSAEEARKWFVTEESGAKEQPTQVQYSSEDMAKWELRALTGGTFAQSPDGKLVEVEPKWPFKTQKAGGRQYENRKAFDKELLEKQRAEVQEVEVGGEEVSE